MLVSEVESGITFIPYTWYPPETVSAALDLVVEHLRVELRTEAVRARGPIPRGYELHWQIEAQEGFGVTVRRRLERLGYVIIFDEPCPASEAITAPTPQGEATIVEHVEQVADWFLRALTGWDLPPIKKPLTAVNDEAVAA